MLSDDGTYATVGFIPNPSNLIEGGFMLSKESFIDVEMPNASVSFLMTLCRRNMRGGAPRLVWKDAKTALSD